MPKSGTKRPSTPASFMRRSVGSGFFSEHSISRKMRLASGSLRSLSSISRSDRRSSRTALGWKKASRLLRLAKKRMRLTGSRLNTSASATLSRPLSMRKSLVVRIWRRVRQLERIEDTGEAGPGLELLDLERRAQDGGQIADVLGDQEIVLHEALDGAQAAAVDIAEALGHCRLHVEGQALLGPARRAPRSG